MKALARAPLGPVAVSDLTQEPAWEHLPEAKRAAASRRETLVKAVLQYVDRGESVRSATEHLLLALDAGRAPVLRDIAGQLGRDGKPPSRATLYRWVNDYRAGGVTALAPAHIGSARQARGWEARAIHLWQSTNRPAMATVAYWLRGEGFESATVSRVTRYLKSLPETCGANSAARMGRHYYNQNLKPYVRRDITVLPVGLVYEGDGHNCDVYVAHPRTGKSWRPEFTPWIDVRSHYVVGWYLSEAESAVSTLFGLSHAITHHDHVPACIHVDPGSGFKNRMMTDEVTGYTTRLSIEFMAALPGNAKGKGLVEGFFHHFEERLGKTFPTYCGHVRTDDGLRRMADKLKRGELTLPTLAQYRDAIAAYIERYNHTRQDELGATPAELWAQLQRTPLELPQAAIVRPREQRTVERWGVTLHNRLYRATELAEHNGREVIVEYDLHDDARVTIRDLTARFICEASLTDRKPWLPVSRIEEMQQKRLAGQIKRKELKIDEDKARAGLLVNHEDTLAAMDLLDGTPARLGDARPAREGVEIDITDTDY